MPLRQTDKQLDKENQCQNARRVKEVPDFSKIHKQWDSKLQKGKAVVKKPLTQIQPFQFNEPRISSRSPGIVTFTADENARKSIFNCTGVEKGQKQHSERATIAVTKRATFRSNIPRPKEFTQRRSLYSKGTIKPQTPLLRTKAATRSEGNNVTQIEIPRPTQIKDSNAVSSDPPKLKDSCLNANNPTKLECKKSVIEAQALQGFSVDFAVDNNALESILNCEGIKVPKSTPKQNSSLGGPQRCSQVIGRIVPYQKPGPNSRFSLRAPINNTEKNAQQRKFSIYSNRDSFTQKPDLMTWLKQLAEEAKAKKNLNLTRTDRGNESLFASRQSFAGSSINKSHAPPETPPTNIKPLQDSTNVRSILKKKSTSNLEKISEELADKPNEKNHQLKVTSITKKEASKKKSNVTGNDVSIPMRTPIRFSAYARRQLQLGLPLPKENRYETLQSVEENLQSKSTDMSSNSETKFSSYVSPPPTGVPVILSTSKKHVRWADSNVSKEEVNTNNELGSRKQIVKQIFEQKSEKYIVEQKSEEKQPFDEGHSSIQASDRNSQPNLLDNEWKDSALDNDKENKAKSTELENIFDGEVVPFNDSMSHDHNEKEYFNEAYDKVRIHRNQGEIVSTTHAYSENMRSSPSLYQIKYVLPAEQPLEHKKNGLNCDNNARDNSTSLRHIDNVSRKKENWSSILSNTELNGVSEVKSCETKDSSEKAICQHKKLELDQQDLYEDVSVSKKICFDGPDKNEIETHDMDIKVTRPIPQIDMELTLASFMENFEEPDTLNSKGKRLPLQSTFLNTPSFLRIAHEGELDGKTPRSLVSSEIQKAPSKRITHKARTPYKQAKLEFLENILREAKQNNAQSYLDPDETRQIEEWMNEINNSEVEVALSENAELAKENDDNHKTDCHKYVDTKETLTEDICRPSFQQCENNSVSINNIQSSSSTSISSNNQLHQPYSVTNTLIGNQNSDNSNHHQNMISHIAPRELCNIKSPSMLKFPTSSETNHFSKHQVMYHLSRETSSTILRPSSLSYLNPHMCCADNESSGRNKDCFPEFSQVSHDNPNQVIYNKDLAVHSEHENNSMKDRNIPESHKKVISSNNGSLPLFSSLNMNTELEKIKYRTMQCDTSTLETPPRYAQTQHFRNHRQDLFQLQSTVNIRNIRSPSMHKFPTPSAIHHFSTNACHTESSNTNNFILRPSSLSCATSEGVSTTDSWNSNKITDVVKSINNAVDKHFHSVRDNEKWTMATDFDNLGDHDLTKDRNKDLVPAENDFAKRKEILKPAILTLDKNNCVSRNSSLSGNNIINNLLIPESKDSTNMSDEDDNDICMVLPKSKQNVGITKTKVVQEKLDYHYKRQPIRITSPLMNQVELEIPKMKRDNFKIAKNSAFNRLPVQCNVLPKFKTSKVRQGQSEMMNYLKKLDLDGGETSVLDAEVSIVTKFGEISGSFSRVKHSLRDGSTNPLLYLLTYGDEMHFIPITKNED